MPRVRPGAACPVAPGTTYFRLELGASSTTQGVDDRFFICNVDQPGTVTFSTSGSWVGVDTATTSSVASNARGGYISYTWTAQNVATEVQPGDGEGVWGVRNEAEQQLYDRRMAEHRARSDERRAARGRAKSLLVSLLNAEQRQQLDDAGGFHVRLPSGNLYEIDADSTIGNVYLLERGRRVAKYCVHPADASQLPTHDTIVAQLLMLQSSEAEFLRVANCHWDERRGVARPSQPEFAQYRDEFNDALDLAAQGGPLVLDVAGDAATVEAFTAEMDADERDIGLGVTTDLDTGEVVPVTEDFTDMDQLELDAEAGVAEAVQRLADLEARALAS